MKELTLEAFRMNLHPSVSGTVDFENSKHNTLDEFADETKFESGNWNKMGLLVYLMEMLSRLLSHADSVRDPDPFQLNCCATKTTSNDDPFRLPDGDNSPGETEMANGSVIRTIASPFVRFWKLLRDASPQRVYARASIPVPSDRSSGKTHPQPVRRFLRQ